MRSSAGVLAGVTARQKVLLLWVFITASHGVSAQELSLAEAFNRALINHPTTRYAEGRARAADTYRDGADNWLAATPSVATRYNTDRVADDIGEREWELILNLPVMPVGERDARMASAAEQSHEAQTEAEHLKLRVAGDVRQLWWQWHRARHELESAQLALTSITRIRDQIARQVEVGASPRADLLLVETQVLDHDSRVLDARAEVDHATRRWSALTGSTSVPSATPEVMVEGEHEQLLIVHPTLRWLTARVNQTAADEMLQASRWSSKPVVGIGYRGERPSVGEHEIQSLGVFFEMPLDFGGYNRSAESLAIRAHADSELDLALQRRNLEVALHDAELAVEAERRASTVAKARLSAAEESARLVRLSFEVGDTSLLALLQAEEALADARAEYGLRHLQAAEAVSLFNQASGVLPL